MQRCFAAWIAFCAARSWKRRVQVCDQQIAQLQNHLRIHLHRRVVIYKKRRQRSIFNAWMSIANDQRLRRNRTTKATRQFNWNMIKTSITKW